MTFELEEIINFSYSFYLILLFSYYRILFIYPPNYPVCYLFYFEAAVFF